MRRVVAGEEQTRVYPELFFLALEESEVGQATRFREVQDRVAEVNDWVRTSVGREHGGTYLSVGSDGAPRFTVLTTGDPAVPPDELEDVVRVARVTYSREHLLSVLETARESLRHTDPAAQLWLDVGANRVVIAGQPEAVEDYRDRSEVVLEPPREVMDQVDKDDAIGYNIVEGGQLIEKFITPLGVWDKFTSAFAVQSGYGPFILTAGHQTSFTYPNMFQGGQQLGTLGARNNQDWFDAAIITTYGYRNAKGNLHVTSSDWLHPVYFISPGDSVGVVVCQTGITTTGVSGDLGSSSSGTVRCGPILRTDLAPGTQYYPVFREADYKSQAGDSGAAVYRSTGYGFSAEGVHKGCNAPSSSPCPTQPFRAIYSSMPYIAYVWGLSLIPPA